jgi:hypothetical protein
VSFYQSSAKSLGIDAGDGQRDDVNTRCLQDISKIESPELFVFTITSTGYRQAAGSP